MARVLMIDDDKDMCEEMVEILGDAIAVNDPARGLKLAGEKKYDLLLLDLKMPEVTGYDILRSVKKQAALIKVMVITGAPLKRILKGEKTLEEKRLEEILELADEVINKSEDISTILKKIKDLTRKT
jgi:two-component system OmpR family response regulator